MLVDPARLVAVDASKSWKWYLGWVATRSDLAIDYRIGLENGVNGILTATRRSLQREQNWDGGETSPE